MFTKQLKESLKSYRRSQSVSWQERNDAVIILDSVEAEIIRLEGCGRDLWQLLEDEKSVEELTDDLASRYDQTEAKIRNDVKRFIKRLLQMELITASEAAVSKHRSVECERNG